MRAQPPSAQSQCRAAIARAAHRPAAPARSHACGHPHSMSHGARCCSPGSDSHGHAAPRHATQGLLGSAPSACVVLHLSHQQQCIWTWMQGGWASALSRHHGNGCDGLMPSAQSNEHGTGLARPRCVRRSVANVVTRSTSRRPGIRSTWTHSRSTLMQSCPSLCPKGSVTRCAWLAPASGPQ